MNHTDAEIEAAARQLEEWADRLDPDTAQVEDISDLRAVAEAADGARRSEAQVVERVSIARAHGRSWNQIALALGVSRQAARQRFAGQVPEATIRRTTARRSRSREIRQFAERAASAEAGSESLPRSVSKG